MRGQEGANNPIKIGRGKIKGGKKGINIYYNYLS